MAEKDEKTKQAKILLFTVAFNVEEKAITFAGNMSAVQAVRLIQQVIQVQVREQIRGEVETEMKQTAKKAGKRGK